MWRADQYYYSIKTLKAIAANYNNLSDGLPLAPEREITDPWMLAEFKADFDSALGGIGRGRWMGSAREFKYYRSFDKLQRIIIADILSIPDNELTRLGFWNIAGLRGYAYYLMKCFLNGGNNGPQSKDNT